MGVLGDMMGGGGGGACLFSKFFRISDKLSFFGGSNDLGIVRVTSALSTFLIAAASDVLIASLLTHLAISFLGVFDS